MSRTPLFHRLRRIAREQRALHEFGWPASAAAEVRAIAAERAFDRRALLTGAAAAAGVLALPGRATARRRSSSIAIVGAGMAGLVAALRLRDRGLDSTVYEVSGRAGGRVFTNSSGYWESNQTTEWCGELIDTGHKTMRKLAKRYHLHLVNLPNVEPVGSSDTFFLSGGYYREADVEQDFAAVVPALDADLAAAGYPTTYDSFTPAGLALDQTSLHDWIDTRVPGGHASRLGRLLDLAYVGEFGAETYDQSALNLIYLLGYQPNASGFAEFGVSDERFRIQGGNSRLPEAIAEDLGVGSTVRYGYRLIAVSHTSSGAVRLTFEHAGAAVDVIADVAILALPFAVLRTLDLSGAGFDALKRRAIDELGRGVNGKLHLQFTQRLWRSAGPWGVSNGSSYSDTGYEGSWEPTRGQAGAPGILCCYSGGDATLGMQTNVPFATASHPLVSLDASHARPQLEAVFPGLSNLVNGRSTQSLPHLSSAFNNSYSYYRVGQYTTFGGYEKVPHGNVFFAGEHTSTDFQGFMEGAASEGRRAANEVSALLQN